MGQVAVLAKPVVRPLLPQEDDGVRALYKLCHPTWPERPPSWFFAYPTLVVSDGRKVIGSTSFSVSYPPQELMSHNTIMYGQDVCVHPEYRKLGIGLALCEARFAIARSVGVTLFLGFTWKQNAPMLAIFEKQGLKLYSEVASQYPDGERCLMYAGPVK